MRGRRRINNNRCRPVEGERKKIEGIARGHQLLGKLLLQRGRHVLRRHAGDDELAADMQDFLRVRAPWLVEEIIHSHKEKLTPGQHVTIPLGGQVLLRGADHQLHQGEADVVVPSSQARSDRLAVFVRERRPEPLLGLRDHRPIEAQGLFRSHGTHTGGRLRVRPRDRQRRECEAWVLRAQTELGRQEGDVRIVGGDRLVGPLRQRRLELRVLFRCLRGADLCRQHLL